MKGAFTMTNSISEEGIKKLGFGYMRLPLKNKSFDTAAVNSMVDRFLEHGFTYFDTAFVYEGSEIALRESLVKRYSRESFQIATKLAIFGMTAPEQQREMLNTSFDRLGVNYVDFYLIHGLDGQSIKKADELDTWGFMRGVKENGRARHIGFSFHGTPAELDTLLTAHPEMEFVQLQINYLDWENPSVRSRELYETARRHNTPITVMEPCKGGLLAGIESEAMRLLLKAEPDVSTASWAFRFVLGLEGVVVALSGMGEMSQIEDNAKTVNSYAPLTDAERRAISEVVRIIDATPGLPCTSCRYCVPHCPKKIMIPQFIKIYNELLVHKNKNSSGYQYAMSTGTGAAQPSDCVKCRVCESHCPQHIAIPEALEKLVEEIAGIKSKYVVNT
jgi:predicted aldo/keto reductase-like oxidoreductase